MLYIADHLVRLTTKQAIVALRVQRTCRASLGPCHLHKPRNRQHAEPGPEARQAVCTGTTAYTHTSRPLPPW